MIYFMWDSGSNAIKIGFATDADERLRNLQVANPNPLFLLGTTDGDIERERSLHRRFAGLRIAGEWFRADPSLMWFIRKASPISTFVGPLGQGGATSDVVAWLEDRFEERREWPGIELRRRARAAGISKNKLHSREVQSLPIRKVPVALEDGKKIWIWMAREGWPGKPDLSRMGSSFPGPPNGAGKAR
jgi:hypothetical protein